MRKRILALILAQVMAVSGAAAVCADEEADVRWELEQNESKLSSTRDALYELAVKKEEIQAVLSTLNSDLVELMVQIDDAELQIATTEEKISETEGQIEETAADLEEAEASRDEQYDAMKKRIQYIYENGGDAGLMIEILESEDLTQFFGRQEYAEQIGTADREELDSLKAVVQEVSDLKDSLEEQKSELETQNGYLKAQKEDLDAQKAELDSQIAEKQAVSDDYAWQIEVAREQAAALTSVISQQNQRLQEIEAEKQAAALAAAEAAARAEREAEAARARAAEEDEDDSDYDDEDDSDYDDEDDSDYDDEDDSDYDDEDDSDYDDEDDSDYDDEDDSDYDEEDDSDYDEEDDSDYDDEDDSDYDDEDDSDYDDEDDSDYDDEDDSDYDDEDDSDYDDEDDSDYDEDDDDSSYSSGNALGELIVATADQYVGYPYVYGGSSLTGGVDCSHFVWLILQKCGAYSGGYMTSAEFPYAGTAVSSLSAARAGDVIVYPHHVAIYDGYGGIVEAKGAAWGITHDRTADHTTILAIRRFT